MNKSILSCFVFALWMLGNFAFGADASQCNCPSISTTSLSGVVAVPNGSPSPSSYQITCAYKNKSILQNPKVGASRRSFKLLPGGTWKLTGIGQYVCVGSSCPFTLVNACPADDTYQPVSTNH